MKHALAAVLSCLAILSGIVGTASGAAATFDTKNRVGVSDQNPNIRTYELGSLELEPQRGDTIIGYDPSSGVLFYVKQNPWTKFDPTGLFELGTAGAVMVVEGAKQVVANPIPHAKAVAGVVVVAGVVIVVATTDSSGGGMPAFETTKGQTTQDPLGGIVDHFTMSQQMSDPGKISVHTEGGSFESNDDGGFTQTSGENVGTHQVGVPSPDGGSATATKEEVDAFISSKGEATQHIKTNSRTDAGPTGDPNSIVEQSRPDGGRSVTYYDEQGRRFSREDYGQTSPHRGVTNGTDGKPVPHEHQYNYSDKGPTGKQIRELDEKGKPVTEWKDD